MKILGIIPARGGSKGVPGKNIKILAGKPLIVHTIEAALSSELTKIIVTTDDREIAAVAKGAGADVPFNRPAELASDTAKSLDVAIHALHALEVADGNYDAVMLLQPTTPFRTIEDINAAIRLLNKNPDADSVISVVNVQAHHPARMKFLKEGRLIDPPFAEAYENQNRQELEPMYIRNGAIYLTKRNVLLNKSYKGKVCIGLIMPEERSVNIDTLQDFKYAEWIHEQYFS
jgi:CMP-N,N'-diacetyllegionaminic acid synthase